MPKIPKRALFVFSHLVILLFCFLCKNTQAETGLTEAAVFGPESFVREAGSPQAVSRDFQILNPAVSYLLKVQNGSLEGEDQVSSAVVTLNGSTILSQKDFNQNAYSLEKQVTLQAVNRLEVKLNSIPSSYITMTIIGYFAPEDMDDDGDGYSENQGDCQDADAAVHPGADEACDGMDNDCDGQTDEGVLNACGECGTLPEEICDSMDNDCDGEVDEGCSPSASLAVLEPRDGSRVYKSTIAVGGTFTGTPSGITVNGQDALIKQGGFYAEGILLTDGVNTITASALDSDGSTESVSIRVNAILGDYVRLRAGIVSGTPPLETYLRIDGSFSIEESSLTYSGPGTVEVTQGLYGDEYNIRILSHGLYTFTAEARDDQNIPYTDSLEIRVLDRDELENHLKGRWQGMKQKLSAQDTEGALVYFAEAGRDKYREIFTALHDKLPEIATDMQAIQLIYAEENLAKCRIRKNQRYAGEVLTITHYIYFVHERDGTWKIQNL